MPIEFDRHFENCYKWINDPEVNEWLAVGDLPMARLAEKEWFEGAEKGRENDVTFAIETLEGRHIGQSGIHRIDYRNGIALTGSLIGEAADRGKGYGTEAATLRAWYCFHVLGLRQLFSEFLSGNELSRRMQEKVGYVEWGVKPKCFWKRGKFRDKHQTVLTRERFFEVNPTWVDKR